MEALSAPRLVTYARFVKVEHTVFSLPLLFAGAWLAAGGFPGVRPLLLIGLAGFGARVVALALNRIIDRNIDARNPRTAIRELPKGRMRPPEAWLVAAAGLLAYLAAAWRLGPICLLLSPVPLAVFAFYPYMKRFTPLAHLGVGAGLAVAPLGAWMAVRQSFDDCGPAILLGAFTLAWVAGFDIIYATLDLEFDRRSGLHSMPQRFGMTRALAVSGALHAAAFLCLALLWAWRFKSPASAFLLAGTGLLLFLEHRRGQDVETAFFRINALIGFVVLALVMAGTGWSPS